MNKDQFWLIVEATLPAKDIDKQISLMEKELKKLNKPDLVEFNNIFKELHNLSYRWDLWAAAYTIQGGCSDDGFMDFRAWLIMRGKTVFENAILNSDSLYSLGIEKLEESQEGEEFNYVMGEIYDDNFNGEIEEDPGTKQLEYKEEPEGITWEEDNIEDLKKINPKLFALYESEWE